MWSPRSARWRTNHGHRPPPLDAPLTGDLLRWCGADEAWWLHDTGCDLVESVVGKEVRAAASILRVDGGHQCSFLRCVVRGPLAGRVHPGDRTGSCLRHEGLGVLVRLCRYIA